MRAVKQAGVALTIAAIIACAVLGNGGSTYITISGRVTHENPQTHHVIPVSGARVWINLDGSATVTDGEGRFRLQSRQKIGEGAEFYVLHAAKDGKSIGQRLLPASLHEIELTLPR